MKKISICFLLAICQFNLFAQFAPPVGQMGTTAMYKDSSAFVAWATSCTITRGYQDISDPGLGYASLGDSTFAIGIAGSNGVVSLGDGGVAILTFNQPIANGPGYDFAVFENAFSDTFLELAFVEVSSDGINYFRFPATSYTQDTIQIDGFGAIDATKINNLAGKYRALYGTPFELDELVGKNGLDVNHITHVKIIDVVGCIQTAFASFDKNGNKINDPWSTPFTSGGFDLDAVGVINESSVGMNEKHSLFSHLKIYPNPISSNSVLVFYLEKSSEVMIEIKDLYGRTVYTLSNTFLNSGMNEINISNLQLNSGIYFIQLTHENEAISQKIIIQNEY